MHPFVHCSVAVALAGDNVLNDEGEEMPVIKTTVGGVVSEGMLCDSRMLGWSGGAMGMVAKMPDSLEIGSAPPLSKPRHDKQEEPSSQQQQEFEGLFEKKLTKEEKKKLAEERRKVRKAVKEAKKAATESSA